ncbi:DUF695 domain-containing protein [Mucilaginibacter sp. SJ]|uniref:DUF695 domain-containing protein n=1 Tax=Mucilaginibacter sp. SJ TaxID=3029053 RepID=UPI0023AA05D2|nr:DUF695 domain-containing protein [Mucilaginibacter sp. SJ]WEA01011.1 DUF695 domain-containing protein [Mucilaginibacter sp. SJ]
MILDDTWVAVKAVSDDDIPLLVRYRPYLSNFFETGVYLQRMDVTWNYESFDPSLLPPADEMLLMGQVEDALVDILEDDYQSILAFVFTGENERWWAWYTTDIDVAGDRLNDALSAFDELPISITVIEDPEWEEYFGVMEDFGEDEV